MNSNTCSCLRDHSNYVEARECLNIAKEAIPMHDGDLGAQVDIVTDYLYDAMHSIDVINPEWKVPDFSVEDLKTAILEVEMLINNKYNGVDINLDYKILQLS